MSYETLANMFPDFDTSSLPDIPTTWEDVSWRGDMCPSFEPAPGVTVFIEHANPDERHIPEYPRFAVYRSEYDVGFHTDDWSAVLAYVTSLG